MRLATFPLPTLREQPTSTSPSARTDPAGRDPRHAVGPTTPRRPDRRVGLVGFVAALAVVLVAAFLRSSVTAGSGEEGEFVARINALRQSVGAPPLEVDANMAALAAGHTSQMAASGSLFHTGSLPDGVSGPWLRLGENIGQGESVDVVWNLFVGSPPHYANIVNPAFTHVGVAVVRDGSGQLWTTQRFVARPGGGGGGGEAAAPAAAVPAAPRQAPRARPSAPPAPAPEPPPPPEPAPPPPPSADPARVGTVLDVLRASPD